MFIVFSPFWRNVLEAEAVMSMGENGACEY